MANSNLDSLVTLVGELGDVYVKSKAVDVAEKNFLLQREDIMARAEERSLDRALKERQIGLSEKQIESSNKLAQLNLFLREQDRLIKEKQNQEKILRQTYKVAPEHQTSATSEIGSMLSGSMDDNIALAGNQINRYRSEISTLDSQINKLMEEEEWYRKEAPKYVGLNKVLQEHEFNKMLEEAKKLEGFQGETQFAGMRKAFGEEMTPRDRIYMTQYMTDKMSRDSNAMATAQFSALKAFTSSENFNWEDQFGSEAMANNAKSALTTTDYKQFLTNINAPGNESLRNIFRNPQGPFSQQLATIEGNAAKVYELERENLGIEAPNPIDDFQAALSTFNFEDSSKEAIYEFYDNFIQSRGVTDFESQSQLFDIIESEYGQDLGEDFMKWKTSDPEKVDKKDDKKVTPPAITDDKKKVVTSPFIPRGVVSTGVNPWFKKPSVPIGRGMIPGGYTESTLVEKNEMESPEIQQDSTEVNFYKELEKRNDAFRKWESNRILEEINDLFPSDTGFGRNPFEDAPTDYVDNYTLQNEALNKLLEASSEPYEFTEPAQHVTDLEGWDRNPFLSIDE